MLKPININNLYKDKLCVIGGGSYFPEQTEYLHHLLKNNENIVVIGVNWWATDQVDYYADWSICCDSIAMSPYFKEQEDKGIFIAAKYQGNLKKQYYGHIDLLWKKINELTETYDKGMKYVQSSSIAAVVMACYFGCKHILLYGVDIGGDYNSKWPSAQDARWNNFDRQLAFKHKEQAGDEMRQELINIRDFYGVNIYNANPVNNSLLPYISLEDFCKGKVYDTASYYKEIKFEKGFIRWEDSAEEIDELIRACYVDPDKYLNEGGARTFIIDRELIVWNARVDYDFNLPEKYNDAKAGTIVALNMEGSWVKTGKGVLFLEQVQFKDAQNKRVKGRFKAESIFSNEQIK